MVSEDRSIGDLLGEALRRHRHGLIRPLWADMPKSEQKAAWRRLGLRWLEDAAGARNAALEAAAHIVDEAAVALGGGTPAAPGVAELHDASAKIRALISDPVPLMSQEER